MDDTLVIYTHPDCGYSSAAKDELSQSDIPFKEIDLSVTPEAWAEVERLTGGERTTPVIVEGGPGNRGVPRRWLKFLAPEAVCFQG